MYQLPKDDDADQLPQDFEWGAQVQPQPVIQASTN